MKKIHVMLIALLGFMSSNTAMAIDLANGPNKISFLTCTQLANDIDVVLSSNVVGSLDCTTDSTIIGVSVCHTTGLTTERSFSTTPETDADGNPVCASGTLNSTTNKCEGSTSGSAFPTATTAAGTVSSQYPATECTAGNAATVAAAAVTAAAD